jgi:predicted acyl esterase
MKALLLAATLLGAALAGCAADPDGHGTRTSAPPPAGGSPAVHRVLPVEEVWVPSQVDGKRLHNAVYRPATDEPVPVFINFSPYWGDTATTGGDAFASYMVEQYVPRGYAVVLSAVRGTGHSEGCFQVGGDLELQDAWDVIEAFAKQPWSNGNVGAGGKSYDSTTQNGVVAKFPHPALKTLFHVSGITDMYRYNAKDGVVYGNGLTFTPRYFASQGLDEYAGATNGAGSAQDEDPESAARLLDDAACPELPEHAASGEGTAATGLKDAYWQERDWIRHLPASPWNGSVFFVHGLQDWNVKPDHVDDWVEVLAQKGIEVKGWLHQDSIPGTGGHVYPMRQDWNATMLRWLDHYLKGVDNGIDRELGWEVQGSDKKWRRDASWPPEGTRLRAEGLVALEATAAAVRVAGTPWVTGTATPLSPDAILHAALYDVGPDGTRTWVNAAARRANLDPSLDRHDPWPVGETRAFNLTFYPMDLELQPGHKLVLELGVDPGAVGGPGGSAGFVVGPGQGNVLYGPAPATHLTLASLDGELDPQPKRMRCFAC